MGRQLKEENENYKLTNENLVKENENISEEMEKMKKKQSSLHTGFQVASGEKLLER